jgi:glutamate receptor, ionotropic, invertebrate
MRFFQRPPFVIFRRNATGHVIGFDGFCFEIVNLLAEVFSFTYTVQIPSDNTYGSQGVDGSWNGMIGMILADQVDMGAGPFTVTEARQEVVDFTMAYYEETTAILTPPPMEDTKILACTKPFQVEVWIALLMVMILFPLILWIQFRLLWRSKKKTGPTSTGSDRCPNLFRQYLFVYAVITTQCGFRHLFLLWSMMHFLGILKSVLTVMLYDEKLSGSCRLLVILPALWLLFGVSAQS